MGRHRCREGVNPVNESKAQAFSVWFGVNAERLRRYVSGGRLPYDEDVFSETFLRVYDAVARCGTSIRDYTGYFLRAYQFVYLDGRRSAPPHEEIDRVRLPPPPSDDDTRELPPDLRGVMLDYVRRNYDESAVSLFEMYVGLLPNISYKRLSCITGVPLSKIWPVMGRIKKDLTERFSKKLGFLLSDGVEF